MTSLSELTDENCNDALVDMLDQNKPHIIGFYTPSSADMLPELEKYAEAHPEWKVFKMDMEKNPKMSYFLLQFSLPPSGLLEGNFLQASRDNFFSTETVKENKPDIEAYIKMADKDIAQKIAAHADVRHEAETKDQVSTPHITVVNEANFEAEVLKSSKPVLIDFWADWCAPCKALAPTLDSFAAENQDVKVVKIDIDVNSALAQQFGIKSIPTLVAMKAGKEVGRSQNDRTKEKIRSFVDGSVAPAVKIPKPAPKSPRP